MSAVPRPRTKVKPKPVDGPTIYEVGGPGRPAPDAAKRLAEFRRKYPPRSLKPGECSIVESLKADRDRR